MEHKWLGSHDVLKNVGKCFFSFKSVESGKIIKWIYGAHFKVYYTRPNSQNSSNLLWPSNPYYHSHILPSPFQLDNWHISLLNHSGVPKLLDPDNSSKSPSSLGLDNHYDVQDS